MSNVFISHRQEDIADIAVRIKDRLAKRFGEAHAFLATGPLARSHPSSDRSPMRFRRRNKNACSNLPGASYIPVTLRQPAITSWLFLRLMGPRGTIANPAHVQF